MNKENCEYRPFKGVWIPVEVWKDDRLTIYEKALWGEVISYGPDIDFSNLEDLKILADFLAKEISPEYRISGSDIAVIAMILNRMQSLGYFKDQKLASSKEVKRYSKMFEEVES